MRFLGEAKCEDQKAAVEKGRDSWVEMVLPRSEVIGLLNDGAYLSKGMLRILAYETNEGANPFNQITKSEEADLMDKFNLYIFNQIYRSSIRVQPHFLLYIYVLWSAINSRERHAFC